MCPIGARFAEEQPVAQRSQFRHRVLLRSARRSGGIAIARQRFDGTQLADTAQHLLRDRMATGRITVEENDLPFKSFL